MSDQKAHLHVTFAVEHTKEDSSPVESILAAQTEWREKEDNEMQFS